MIGARLAALGAACLVLACSQAPEVEPLAGPAFGASNASDPALAVDVGTGDALLAWVAGDSARWHLYFSRSTDRARTWATPVQVTVRPNEVHPHGESSPRLVAAPGSIALVWTSSEHVSGRRWPASNIRFSRSTDGGRTWSAPITLNDDTTAAPSGHIFHGAAWNGDSGLVVAWLDERTMPAPPGAPPTDGTDEYASVYLAASRDLGRTWLPNRPLWPAACPCCRVALARGPRGEAVAAWRENFPGNVRDVIVTPISHEPVTPRRVHPDGWVHPGCPHTGPGVAVDAAGNTHVTWYSGKPGATGVFYSRSPPGDDFGTPTVIVKRRVLPSAHPRVATLPDGGALVVVDVAGERGKDLVVVRLSPDGRVTGRAVAPVLAAVDHPEVVVLDSATALVAWSEQAIGQTAVRVAEVLLRRGR